MEVKQTMVMVIDDQLKSTKLTGDKTNYYEGRLNREHEKMLNAFSLCPASKFSAQGTTLQTGDIMGLILQPEDFKEF